MTPTTKRFAWHDRDTAARDLLQLAIYAPPTIRARALRLLRQIRSPAILPELEQIVLDESRDIWEQHYALCATAMTPGDLYLPQLAEFSDPDHELFHAVMMFANNHPRNLEWAFYRIDGLPHQMALKPLVRLIEAFHPDSMLNPLLFQRIIHILEKHPLLLKPHIIQTLYEHSRAEDLQRWSSAQWKTLIYECLLSGTHQSFHLLNKWVELREAVFRNCASMREEYSQREQSVQSRVRNYQLSELWQKVCLIYTRALRGDESSYKYLVEIATYETGNVARRAIATNFLGKLKHQYDVQTPLLNILRRIPVESPHRYINDVRFEAGYALCEMPSPTVWEAMIDIFLTLPENSLEGNLPSWIAYLTDYLGGKDMEPAGIKGQWGNEEQRMLRYTFDDMHPENQDEPNQRPEW